jgi:hypothetical protein
MLRRRRRKRNVKNLPITALLVAALAAPAAAGHLVVPPGYGLSEVSFTGFVGGFDIAPNGDFIVLEDQNLYEVTPAGSFVRDLYTYPSFVYGSFVRVDAARGRVYFGESSNGWISSVGLDGSNPTDAAKVPLNYDFALNDLGQAFVVAGPAVYLLGAGGPDQIVSASGASGPLAFDADGNLYYGTASSVWGEIGGQAIVRWTASQVAAAVGPGALTIADGEKLLDDIDGPSGFAFDPSGLYFTSSVQYPGQVVRYAGGAASVVTAADPAAGYSWLTAIRTNPATGTISVLVGTFSETTISTLAQVPEPASLAALAFGLGAALLRRRR